MWFGGAAEVRRFESSAAREIGRRLGGAEQVQVRVKLAGLGPLRGDIARATVNARGFGVPGMPLFTEPERSTRGRLGTLEIRLREFTLAGLKVESLEATVPNCRYDFGLATRRRHIAVSRTGEGTGRVVLREADVAAYARRKHPLLRDLLVVVTEAGVRVTGRGDILMLRTGFDLNAQLVGRGSRVEIGEATLKIGGTEATPEVRRAVVAVLNPMIDLDRDLQLAGAMTLERVVLSKGRISAEGRLRVPVEPERRARFLAVARWLARAAAVP